MNATSRKYAVAALALAMAVPVAVSAPAPAKANDAFVGGLVGGVIGGAIGSSRRRDRDVVIVDRRRPVYEERVIVRPAGNAHVNWCYNRYRSYDARTDTYVSYGGRVRYCNSPYN